MVHFFILPLEAEFDALVSKCNTKWTTTNGVRGRLVTGKGSYANRGIFLPVAGRGLNSNLKYAGSDGFC